MQPTPDEARRKMLRMRSWRRGMKEMDLILGPYADAHLDAMSTAEMEDYDRLLSENDQDLYLWVTGAQPCPAPLKPLLDRIGRAAGVARSA